MDKSSTKISNLIIPFLKNIKLVISVVFIVTSASLVLSLSLTKTYLSTSEVIHTNQSVGSFGGILQNLGSFGSGQRKVGGETILVILNSQSLRDSLIEEFDLFTKYDQDFKESLYRMMGERFQFEEVREGGLGFNPIVSVKIRVVDESPELAQQMNQYVLNYLSAKMEAINNDNSRYSLDLIKKRFQQNQEELLSAEEALNNFQNLYGIFEVTTQLSVIIESIALVKQQIIESEIQLQLIDLNFGKQSSQFQSKNIELKTLSNKYEELIARSSSPEQVEFASPNLKDVPDLVLEYARLLREVEVQNKIYEFILPELEQQELYLLNSNSGLNIIDRPDLPTYKYKPKRAYVVIAGFMFSLTLVGVIVLYREALKKENSELHKIINFIKSEN